MTPSTTRSDRRRHAERLTSRGAQVWTPVGPALADVFRRDSMPPLKQRSLGVLYVLGRLKTGVTPASAQGDLAAVSRRLSVADSFSTTGGWGARVIPLVDHHLGASTRQALEALAVASGLVLVLACANVAVLLLVQAIRRRTDLAVRRALGARARQVVLSVDRDGDAGAGRRHPRHWSRRHRSGRGRLRTAGVRPRDVRVEPRSRVRSGHGRRGRARGPRSAWIASRLSIAPALRPGRRWRTGQRGFQLTGMLVTTEVARRSCCSWVAD